MNSFKILKPEKRKGPYLQKDGLLDKLLHYYQNDLEELDQKLYMLSQMYCIRQDNFLDQINKTETHRNGGIKIESGGKKEYAIWLTILHTVLGVQLDKFTEPERNSKEHNPKHALEKRNIFNHNKAVDEGAIESFDPEYFEVLHIDSSNEDDYDNHMDNYVELMKEFINSSGRKLKVYDYLHRHSFKGSDETKTYSEKHNEIYKHIFDRAFESEFSNDYSYNRILAIPVNSHLSEVDFIHQKLSKEDKVKALVLKYCPPTLLEHMLMCLEKEQLYADTSYHSGFIMTKSAVRTYQFAICGDEGTEFYMEELSKYKKGECRPDILIMGICNGRYKVGTREYKKDFKEYLGNTSLQKFSETDVKFILERLIKRQSKLADSEYYRKNDLRVPHFSELDYLKKELQVLNRKLELIKDYPKCTTTTLEYQS
ncbi:MAG: hypothetical protein JXR11_02590 [Balneola sp.]